MHIVENVGLRLNGIQRSIDQAERPENLAAKSQKQESILFQSDKRFIWDLVSFVEVFY